MSILTEQSGRNESCCFSLPVYFDLKARFPLWLIRRMIRFLLGMDEIFSSVVTLRESARWSLQSTLKWFGSKTGGITTREQHCYWPTGASDVWRLPHHFLLHVVQLPERQTHLQRARRFEQSRNTKCLIMPPWRRAQCPEKWKTRYVVSSRVYVLIFGMKCIVHLGLQHATINAAKTNFAPLLKSAWHRSTNLRDGMGCFEGRSWFLLFDSAFETSAAGIIWSKEIGQWTEGWFHIERDWKPQTWCWKCPTTSYTMCHH